MECLASEKWGNNSCACIVSLTSDLLGMCCQTALRKSRATWERGAADCRSGACLFCLPVYRAAPPPL